MSTFNGTILLRKGLEVDLPALNLAELGFAKDEPRIYIGGVNGNVPIPNKGDIDSIYAQLSNTSGKIFTIPYIYDGVENCTSALQTLIDNAYAQGYNHVIFEEGAYMVNNLYFRSNTLYEGHGNVIFKSKDGAIVWSVGAYISSASNIVVRGIDFDGNKANVAGSGASGVSNLRIIDASNVLVEKCDFYNNYYGNIYFNNTDTVEVRNCTFVESDVGILFMGVVSKNIYLHDNIIDGTGGTSEGISIYDCDDNTTYHQNIIICNNTISNKVNSDGMRIVQFKNLEVYNNRCIGNGTGIGLRVPDNGKTVLNENANVHDNYITTSGSFDICVQSASNISIINNNSRDTKGQFSKIENADDVQIIGNKAINYNASDGQYGFGIELASVTNAYVEDNTLITSNMVYAMQIGPSTAGTNSSTIYIVDNIFLPITSSAISLYNGKVDNIYILNNFANISYSASAAIMKGNTTMETAPRTFTLTAGWSGISFCNDEVMLVATTSSSLLTNNTISTAGAYGGKKVTYISTTNLIQLIASATLVFKNSVATYTPMVDEVIDFVFDGTRWMQK